MRRRYLVTYDISDDKRRTRVFNILMGRGDHIQYSVFLCELNAKEKAQMLLALRGHVHRYADQLLMIDLGPAHQPLELGKNLECLGAAFCPASRVLVI